MEHKRSIVQLKLQQNYMLFTAFNSSCNKYWNVMVNINLNLDALRFHELYRVCHEGLYIVVHVDSFLGNKK